MSRNPMEQKPRSIKSDPYFGQTDIRLDFFPDGPDNYVFTASDREFYDLLTILEPANVLKLLSDGVRSMEEARAALKKRSATDLIIDRSELVAELIRRGISPEEAAAGIMWTALDKNQRRTNLGDYPPMLHADAVELLIIIKDKDGSDGYEAQHISIREYVLQGLLTLDTVKAILPEMMRTTQLASMTTVILDLAATPRKYDFTIDDLVRFARKAGSFYGITLRRLSTVFAVYGISVIDRIDNLTELSNFIHVRDAELNFQLRTEAEEADDCFLAIQATMYLQELSKLRPLTESEYATVMQDALSLHQSGITLSEALPYLAEGIPANRVYGVINGVETSVAEGWL